MKASALVRVPPPVHLEAVVNKEVTTAFSHKKKSASVILKPASLDKTYRPARLMDCGGDISKRWYIVVYALNIDLGKLERGRDYSINKYKDEATRRYEAAKRINVLNSMLKDGAYRDTELKVKKKADKPKQEPKTEERNFIALLNSAIQLKSMSLRPNTVKGLKYTQSLYVEWATYHSHQKVQIQLIRKPFIYAFLDSIEFKKKLANKTYNNIKGYLSSIFNFYKQRGVIEANPMTDIRKKRVESGTHTPYTREQLEDLKKAMLANKDEQMLLFVQFIYYTFLRPNAELRLLQVHHLSDKTIFCPASISKNGKGEHVIIPPKLNELIDQLNIRSYPKDFYIFSENGLPGKTLMGINYFYKKNRKYLKICGLTYASYDLYGYKHTGVIAWFNAGADIKSIQKQCRHHSIIQTDTYMRNLGLIRNEDTNNFPTF